MKFIQVDYDIIKSLNEIRPRECHMLSPVITNSGDHVLPFDLFIDAGRWRYAIDYLMSCEIVTLEVSDFPDIYMNNLK